MYLTITPTILSISTNQIIRYGVIHNHFTFLRLDLQLDLVLHHSLHIIITFIPFDIYPIVHADSIPILIVIDHFCFLLSHQYAFSIFRVLDQFITVFPDYGEQLSEHKRDFLHTEFIVVPIIIELDQSLSLFLF